MTTMGDIDITLKPQKLQLWLARPDKTIISKLSEAYQKTNVLKLGNINEISISVPYDIEIDHKLKRNPNIDNLMDRYLIKSIVNNVEEWYTIRKISDDMEDSSDVKSVTAYLLPYELNDKLVGVFEQDGINLTKALSGGIVVDVDTGQSVTIDGILKNTRWTLGTVDASFDTKYRTVDVTGKTKLDAIFHVAEVFKALITWDTVNRKINFLDPDSYGRNLGFTLSYGRYLKTLNRESNSDEMVTRLKVFGKDISIQKYNITGQNYLEDFSFFMYPFARDASKNVTSHSYYMTDALCNGLLDYSEFVETKKSQFNTLLTQKEGYESTLTTKNNEKSTLEEEMAVILNQLDTENSAGHSVSQLIIDKTAKQAQIDAKNSEITAVNAQITTVDGQITTLRGSIAMSNFLTQQLLDELNDFIVEKEWSNQEYVYEKDLYEEAERQFSKMNEPQLVIKVDAVNFFDIVESQRDWNKLALGDNVVIRYEKMNINVTAKIIEIHMDYEDSSIQITIANTKDIQDDEEKLIKLLYNSSSASTTIDMNKYKWDSGGTSSSAINNIINNTWNAIKTGISAGVNNSISISERGILVTNPTEPLKYLIIQNGVMAITADGGNTWKNAITSNGIVADRLFGKIIAGVNLTIDASDTGGTKIFTVDGNGVTIAGTSLTITNGISESNINSTSVSKWNSAEANAKQYTDAQVLTISDELSTLSSDNKLTPTEKQMIKKDWDGIIAEKPTIDSQADVFSITTEKTNYDNSYNTLNTYIAPILSDLNSTSDIVGSTLRSNFKDYFDKRALLIKAVTDKAKTLADNAQTSANTANNTLSDIANDSKLTPVEKQAIKLEWDTILSEKTNIDTQATTYSITTEKTTYDNSFQTLANYLNGGTTYVSGTPSMLSNLATTDTIVGDTFRLNFKTYYDARTLLLKAISDKAKSLVDTAQTTATNAWSKFSGAGNTLPSGNVEFNFANSSSKGGNATNTDNVGSKTATEVSTVTGNFNSRNDRKSTTPATAVIATDGTAIDHTVNTDGSCDISFEWTFTGTGDAYDIDGFVVYMYSSSTNTAYTFGTTPANEQVFNVTPDKRAFIIYGVPANNYYTFGVKPYRMVDNDINSNGIIYGTIAKSTATGENPYQPSSTVAFAGNITGTVNGTAVLAITNAVTNFNNRNDRKSTAPASPTILSDGTSVDHTVNTDGSADISFEWVFTGTGDSYDIDGFVVYLYQSSTNTAYTFGTTVASEQVFYVTPEKRAFILYGVAANKYYTFGVQAYRIVDGDISASGVLKSAIIKPSLSAENPYQPSASVLFTGDVTGTINGTSASSVASSANNSVQKATAYNGVVIDATNGLVITKTDNIIRTLLNATDGFKFQKNISGTWTDKLSYDVATGNLVVDGSINARELKINGTNVLVGNQISGQYIDKITAGQIDVTSAKITTAMIENLVVGTNVTMGANATISWANVTSQPTIPTVPNYITATKITSTTIESPTITGGTITSIGSINAGTSLSVGSSVILNGNVDQSIVFSGVGDIKFKTNGTIGINGSGSLVVSTPVFQWITGGNYEDVATRQWVSANSFAKFG